MSFDVKDPLKETAEVPTLWTVTTTLNGEQDLDGIKTKLKGFTGKESVHMESDEVSPLKINLTVVNSTFNYTTSNKVRMTQNMNISVYFFTFHLNIQHTYKQFDELFDLNGLFNIQNK